MKIGERVRQARLQRGLSQGEVENRTGLLRCYLSRVENGHTEPSLQTLARLAKALELPLVALFEDEVLLHAGSSCRPDGAPWSATEVAFLAEMRKCAATLSESERRQVLALAKKMAEASKAAGAAAS